jgi:hypothetical protein
MGFIDLNPLNPLNPPNPLNPRILRSRPTAPVAKSLRAFRASAASALALVALASAPAGAQGAPPAQPATSGAPAAAASPPNVVKVLGDAEGLRLQVDGRDFLVFGMNWDYFPIGTNYKYSLWTQPDDLIEAALSREMPLLKQMGVNALRLYSGIPAKWVRFIYERWGIYTVLNHTVGRYGYTLDGLWIPAVDYSDPRIRAALKAETLAMVEQYRGVPGLLMWLYGNENNYGLSWSSFEIENLPKGDREKAKAKFLYSLFGEIIRETKARDPLHPVAIAIGDVQYIDLIAEECKGLDILGANVYRGKSAGDLYQVVHDKLGLPVLFTEFGADAYDAKLMKEDDVTQARYLLAQWQEIYEQTAFKGRVGNAIGGFIFQWSDGWWKYNQDTHLDVHDTNASWANGGYKEDFVEGQNNMNEEWWGLCAKGQPDDRGLYELFPRSSFYALRVAFRLSPYAPDTDLATIRDWFAQIEPTLIAWHYRNDAAAQAIGELKLARLTGLRMSFESIGNGGSRISTPLVNRTVDHMESFYADLEAHPSDRVTATLSLNVLGNVAANPIDKIFYESRGLPVRVECQPLAGDATQCAKQASGDGPSTQLSGLDRLRVYKAAISWDEPYFKLEGFFRTGHYHWGYEGDFFGLYREANYGTNIDTYNADAPAGFEVTFKQELDGLKLAIGPQLWWGANPAMMAKYKRRVGDFDLAILHQEQLGVQGSIATSAVIPEPKTRKTTLYASTRFGPALVELGAIAAGWGLPGCGSSDYCGSARIGNVFQKQVGGIARPDQIRASDTLGAKAKVSVEKDLWHWYGQAALMGLVADGGPQQTVTYTGWYLKDSGSGNQGNILTGLAVNLGPFQLGPNFLWQRPLVGPGPSNDPSKAARNILVDPFVVRSNREMVAAEMMVVYDPTPGTWMWAWDNDLREDAPFAASLDFLYKHQNGSQDAGIGVLADGTQFAFPGAPPKRDLWEINARLIGAPLPGVRVLSHLFAGIGEPNGSDPRAVHRYGLDLRASWKQVVLAGFAKFNDWGPYDYHRDYNLTYPVQLMGDLGYTLGQVRWLGPAQTRVGLRGTMRYLNGYSPLFQADLSNPTAWGSEYELRTYLVVAM